MRRGAFCSVCPQMAESHKLASEVGASSGYHLGRQRWAWTATTTDAATKDPVCKCRSLPTPSWKPVQHATARVPWSRANFGRTHGTPQAVATSGRPLPLQTLPASQLWLPYLSLSLARVSKRALISHCFNTLFSGRGTDVWGWPTYRGGAKTEAEPQELCKQRREREISLCSLRSSRLNPSNWLGKHCICGIPEYTMSVPKIEVVDFGGNCGLGFWFWFYVYLSLVLVFVFVCGFVYCFCCSLPFFPLFLWVCGYVSLCDFVCLVLLLAFDFGFSLVFFLCVCVNVCMLHCVIFHHKFLK